MKTRPLKTKSFIWMFIPILYHRMTKKKKRVFCDAKVIEGPKAPKGPLRVFFRFHSDMVLLILSDRVLFEFSVIGFSSESSVIDSSLGSSVLFFRHAHIFYRNVLLLFLLKTDVLFYFIFSKRTSHLTISSEKNGEILAWYRHEILYWKCMPLVSRFTNYLYCWIYSSYIPADIYLLKVDNRNTRTGFEICLKLTIKTPERRRRSSVSIVNFEQVNAG